MTLYRSLVIGVGLLAFAPGATQGETLPTVARWKGNRQAAVSYTFDDNYLEHYTMLKPKFEEYHLTATFYIVNNFVFGNTWKDYKMTWEQIKELGEAGFEIGSHGYAHVNHQKCTREEAAEDVRLNSAAILEHTGIKVRTFAYPDNATSSFSESVLKENGLYIYRIINRSFPLGGSYTTAKYNETVDAAVANKSWQIFLGHSVTAAHYSGFPNPQVLWDHLANVAARKDVWVGTIYDVGVYEALRQKTKVSVAATGEKTYRVTVTAPELDREYYSAKLDLVLPSGNLYAFDPFGGDFTVTDDGTVTPEEPEDDPPVTPDPPAPTGPTFAAGTHVWTSAADGAWNESTNWTTRPSGSDWPNHAGAMATVSAAAAIDLGGETVTLKQFTSSGPAVTLRNGTIRIGAGDGANSCFQTTAEGGTLTLENVNLESTEASTSYKTHCVNPYAAKATIAFAGDCALKGMVLRSSNAGARFVFKDGVTTSDSTVSVGTDITGASPLVFEFDNARLVAQSFDRKGCAFELTLGTNNLTGAVLTCTGSFAPDAGSALRAVHAAALEAGTYTLVSVPRRWRRAPIRLCRRVRSATLRTFSRLRNSRWARGSRVRWRWRETRWS